MHQYQAKAAVHPRPAKADPPLKSKAPKPAFINAEQNSAFGFNSRAPPSDVEMEPGVVEGADSAEERPAEEAFNQSESHNNNGESHSPVFYNSSLQIFLLDDDDHNWDHNGLSSLTSHITRLIQIRTPD
jgi:hypothetical protein